MVLKKKKDWYGISAPDFKNNGFDQLLRLYNHSPKKIVTNILSEYKFDVTKFDFSSKYEFRARCYAKCLFGQKEIIANAKLKIFESKKSGRSFEYKRICRLGYNQANATKENSMRSLTP